MNASIPPININIASSPSHQEEKMSKRLVGDIEGKHKNSCHGIKNRFPKYCCLNKNLNPSLDLLSIPQSGGKMSKRLGGIIGCKYKTSSRHLKRFKRKI